MTIDPSDRFEQRRREWNVEGFRAAAFTATPVIALSVFVEEMFEIPLAMERNLLRAICLGLLALGLALASRRKDLALANIDWMMPVVFLWCAFLSVTLMHLHDGYESPYYLTLAFCVVGVPAVSLWPPKIFIAYEGMLYLLYLAPLALGLASIRSQDTFLVRILFLMGLTGIGAATQWMHNRMVRVEIGTQSDLEAALERIAGLKEERTAWLERLAGFLRHELKNQMVAMDTSLSLMEQTEAAGARSQYVERARRSLGRMSRLVGSATEATSLEAALASELREPVDLSMIVEDRLEVLRQEFAPRLPVTKIESNVIVVGNEDRLAQVLDKLLSNAAEHVARTGEIRVELRRDAQEALLTVEDDGDLLPEDKARLFNAFVSVGKNRSEPGIRGLGLFVTRVVVESFGGHVLAQNLPNGGGARFVVRLPLR